MPALRHAAGLQSFEVTKAVAVLSPALRQEVTCLTFSAQALAGISSMDCRESRWVRPDVTSACREPEGGRGLDESTSDIRAAHSADLDDPAEDDVAIILGGPIGACDDRVCPFLKTEAAYIEERLLHGRAIMGICLGAQLMARSLGSRVYRASEREIGFFPVNLTPHGSESCLASLRGEPILHWHGDTLDLPTGAVNLACTRVCENQALSYGCNAIAFQFHPEIGAAGFERWLVGHAFELGARATRRERIETSLRLDPFGS